LASRPRGTATTVFKGSWLAFLLKELGADVMGGARPEVNRRPEKKSQFALLNLQARSAHVIVDVRDASA